jgi:hypothetical protein
MTGRSAFAHHHQMRPPRPPRGPLSPRPSKQKHNKKAERGRSSDGQVVGALLVIVGFAWIAHQTGAVDFTLQTVLSCLLVTLGVGMVITARRAGGGGLVLLGVLLTLAVAASSATLDLKGVQAGFGERTEHPVGALGLQPTYEHGLGSMTLDLTDIDLPEGTQHTAVKITVGQLRIVVPEGLEFQVKTRISAGQLLVYGKPVEEGPNITRGYTSPDFDAAMKKVIITATVGAGSVEVVHAGQ